MFIVFLASIVNAYNITKCVSINNQKRGIQPTIINLHSNKYSQECRYYPFLVRLNGCVGSCNTINDLSNKAHVPNKTKDLNLNVFNMITGINEPKTLTKHISCKCKCKYDGTKCNSNNGGIMINVDVNVKNIIYAKKDYVWNPAT